MKPALYIAITSHGFGHAVRTASVGTHLKKICPDLRLIFVTTVPKWLIESYVPGDFEYRQRIFDVGVIQSDSIKMDLDATKMKMRAIQQKQDDIIAEEVEFIKNQNVRLILADIPPLVTKIAESAKIPCWMMSNFGWDFIYRDWDSSFREIVSWIEHCYSKCNLLFRLPLAEPMSFFSNINDVGLTGGNPRYSVKELQEKFNLTKPKDKTILLTFGGLGLQSIPYQNLTKFEDWQFITFDRSAPKMPNLKIISGEVYRPVDFMPLCSRVISKPGYSTFAEALRLDLPIISLTREGFSESIVLLQGIQNHSYHQIINTIEFFNGDWNFLHSSLIKPQTNIKLPKNGSETIAQKVGDYFV